MSKANADIVRRIESAWERDAMDELDGLFAPDFRALSNVPGMPPGLAGAKAAHAMVRQFLADRRTEIVDLIDEGDRVFVRTRSRGTNAKGIPWLGAPANGQPYDFESWSVYTIRSGRVVEHVGLNDVWLLAIQTGAVTPPAPPSR